MNYDLAMMALEGLARAPMTLHSTAGEITIEGEASAFKELARLCLLLGGTQTASEEFELTPGVHLDATGPVLRLRLREE
ncbi:MAG: hypothetical protein ACLGH0_14610 [Thermoanaerobaculia bacterium]